MKFALSALAASMALMGLASLAEAQGPAPPPSAFKQPTLDIGTATMYPDVIYSRPAGGYRPLKLDIYRPKQQSGPLPAVIWMHGGGWQGGDQRGGAFAGVDMPTLLGEVASHGYVAVSIQYRLTGEAIFPAQVQDARAAVRWLKANAATYGIDASKIFVWGGSAGGYLAAMTAVACGEAGLNPPLPPARAGMPPPAPPAAGSECVQGAVLFYPATDLPAAALLTPPNEDTPIRHLLGCMPPQCPADKMALASVVDKIDAKDPAFLIFQGDSDRTLPGNEAQARLLDAALKAKGVKTELNIVPGGDHVFPNLAPAKRKEIMDRVYAFLDKQSGKTK